MRFDIRPGVRRALRLPAFTREQTDAEVDEELDSLLIHRIEHLVDSGMTTEDATRVAMSHLGSSLTDARMRLRKARPHGRTFGRCLELAIDALSLHVRLAFRVMRRVPRFTAIVVLTIAIGVGASAAIFSAVDAVMLRPLPFSDGDRLVSLWGTNPDKSIPRYGVSYPDFRDWKQRARSFDDMALYVSSVATVMGSGGPESVACLHVTSNFLRVLGIEPIVGRGFGPDDDRGESSTRVLLSHGYWQRRFAGDPAVIGQRITVDGRSRVIAGVLPSQARLLGPAFVGAPLDIVTVVELSTYANVEHHAQHLFGAIGRLKTGATIQRARGELNQIETQVAAENTEIAGWTASVFFLADDLSLDTKEPLLILLAASFLLLLISCINVANLLLVRGSARLRETALRHALGASRGTLVSQFFVEAVILALSGALLGMGLSTLIIDAIRRLIPAGSIALVDQVTVDGRVIAFTIVASLVTALLFGLWPAFRTARLHGGVAHELRNRTIGAAAESVSQRALVIAEVALALVLIIGTGLVTQSVYRMLTVDPGFSADHVVTASLSLGTDYPDSAGIAFYRTLTTRLEAQPGIEAAGATDTPPLGGAGIFTSIRLAGEAPRPTDQPLMTTIRAITPGYFRALGMHISRGQDLTWSETTPSIVVSRSAAERFWPRQSPLNKQVAFNIRPRGYPVVGEVNDARQLSLAASPAPTLYVSMRHYAQVFHTMTLIVRGQGSAERLVATIRSVLRGIDPRLPLYDVQTMRSIVDESTARQRLEMILLAMFAGAAVFLATLGIYGVVSYAVTQRRQELGVRLTLGASRGDILRLIVGEGLALGAAGAAIGVAVALVATRLLQSWLFEIGRTDPLTFATSTALLLTVAAIASYVPARRAARVDPLVSIRTE